MKEETFEFLFDPQTSTFLPNVRIISDEFNKIQQIEVDSFCQTNYRKGFYVPGFINMHAHLEYSWMKGFIPPFKKMPFFIEQMKRFSQVCDESEKNEKAKQAINNLKINGTVYVVDICNSFLNVKKEEPSFFTNLIEIFGVDPRQASAKIELAENIYQSYISSGMEAFFTPHSLFSLSDPLWNYVLPQINNAPFYSIHFMESRYELDILKDPVEKAVSLLPKNKRVFFVHNTYATEKDLLRLLDYFHDSWFVLCPGSNYYIEKRIPRIEMFVHFCPDRILLGTDSLASNWSTNLWHEIRFLLKHFPTIPLTFWLKAVTYNAAHALRKNHLFGEIDTGKFMSVHSIPANFLANK